MPPSTSSTQHKVPEAPVWDSTGSEEPNARLAQYTQQYRHACSSGEAQHAVRNKFNVPPVSPCVTLRRRPDLRPRHSTHKHDVSPECTAPTLHLLRPNITTRRVFVHTESPQTRRHSRTHTVTHKHNTYTLAYSSRMQMMLSSHTYLLLALTHMDALNSTAPTRWRAVV